jgi:hypothetical protein
VRDTPPALQQRYYEHLARLSPAQRLERLLQLNQALTDLALAGIQERFPDATARVQQAHLADRRYGRAIALRFFPDVFGEKAD